MIRYCSCGCNSCLNDNKEICDKIRTFKDCEYSIRPQLHVLCEKVGFMLDEYDDLFDDKFDCLDKIGYFETEASKMITTGDIIVIKICDNHPYYLLNLTKYPYETDETVCNCYNHKFLPYHQVLEDNYLDLGKEQEDNDVYYIDY